MLGVCSGDWGGVMEELIDWILVILFCTPSIISVVIIIDTFKKIHSNLDKVV